MKQGIIIKGVGSFYSVLTDHGEILTCKARGIFRKQNLVPTVGDQVTVTEQERGYALLSEILPRKNVLLRPAVANIDRIFLVISASRPEPDYLLLDEMILHALKLGIEPIPVMNKIDEADTGIIDQFQKDYACFDTITVSALSGSGIETLRKYMEGHTSCFAGQSAVGKSSLLNTLFTDLDLEVGTLSRKTEHGKHTTRHAQLIPFAGGAVLDTPGFSLFEPEPFEQAELNALYPEFKRAPFPCRYPDCMHDSEPDCGIKELVAEGGMPRSRYQRYLLIARENQDRRKHRYD